MRNLKSIGWVVACVTLVACVAAGAPPASYEAKLAEARRLAAEKSWTLAVSAFDQARELAPDKQAARWCTLWGADAAWRSVGRPGRDHLAAFDEALEIGAPLRVEDAFALAVRESRVEMLARFDLWEACAEALRVADSLGEAARSPEAVRRYVEFLARVRPPILPTGGRETVVAWTIHLSRAAALTDDVTARGRIAEALALCAVVRERDALAWRHDQLLRALDCGRATPVEPVLIAAESFFRMMTGYSPGSAEDAAVAAEVMLAQLRECERVFDDTTNSASEVLRTRFHAFARWWTKPMLFIDAAEVIEPGGRLEFFHGGAHVARLECALFRLSGLDAALAHADGIDHGTYGLAARSFDVPKDAELIWEESITNDGADVRWRDGHMIIPQALEPGNYVLIVRTEHDLPALTRKQWFRVSAVEALTVTAHSRPTSLLLYDRRTGVPLTGRDVSVAFREKESVTNISAKTDDTGMIAVPAASAEAYSHAQTLVGLIDGQPFAVSRIDYDAGGSGVIADLFVDRELFRPGETVQWKLIVRERRAGKFVIPERALRISLPFSNEQDELVLVEDEPIVLDAWGSAHGSIVLPATLPPGRLAMEISAQQGDDWFEVGRVAMARVEHVVAPALRAEIELEGGAGKLLPGVAVVVRVRASYASGGPAAGVPVRLESTETAHWAAGSHAYRAGGLWSEAKTKDLAGVTDAAGVAEFSLSLADSGDRGASLDVAATLVPEGGQAVQAEAGWEVIPGGVQVCHQDAETVRWIRPGEPVEFLAQAVDGAGEPRAFTGVARLVRQQRRDEWLDPQGRSVAGTALAEARVRLDLHSTESLPKPWQKVISEQIEDVVEAAPVRAGPDGRLRVSFAMSEPGLYAVQWLRDGERLDVSTREPWRRDTRPRVVVCDPAGSGAILSPGENFLLLRPRATSDTALHGLAIVPEGVERAWLVISGEEDSVVRPLALRGRFAEFVLDELPTIAGKGLVRVIWPPTPRGRQFGGQATAKIDGPASTVPVSVEVQTPPQVRPGDRGEIVIRAVDPSRRPVALAVAVSDEAINRITHRKVQDTTPFDSFERYEFVAPFFSRPGRTAALREYVRDVRPGRSLNPTGDPFDEVDWLNENPVGYEGPGARSTESYAASMGGRLGAGAGLDVEAAAEAARARASRIRRHFLSTALWAPVVETDERGEARVQFTYPDNLTQWRVEVYATGVEPHAFGRATAFTRASLPFQARLQAPRFLIEGDRAYPSVVYVNRTSAGLRIDGGLRAEGAIARDAGNGAGPVQVPAQSEARTAWAITARGAGDALLRLEARAGEQSDGIELALPVYPDVVVQETAASGLLAAGRTKQVVTLVLPRSLKDARPEVTLVLTPGVAAPLVDALPYLVTYPYGCVEQTVSRFVPAVVARRVLARYGLDAAQLDAHLRAAPPAVGSLDDVVRACLAKLEQARVPYEGFGWWPGAPVADRWMTAYVLWGLTEARRAGVELPESLWDETLSACTDALRFADMGDDRDVWALAAAARADGDERILGKAFREAFARRERFTASGRACLALATARLGDEEQKATILRNLENGARIAPSDTGMDTVCWGRDGDYSRAMDSPIEATALTLLALLELQPNHRHIQPAANWLALNRRCNRWAGTRDTALAVLALAEHLSRAGPEPRRVTEVRTIVNGKVIGVSRLDAVALLAGGLRLAVDPAVLRPGANRIELLRASGGGIVHLAAFATARVPGASVQPAGQRLTLSRRFVRNRERATVAGVVRIEPVDVVEGGSVGEGELVTARVRLSVPDGIDYVMIEVPRPAGCEPVAPLSGWDARLMEVGTTAPANVDPEDMSGAIYREEREDRSVFFIDELEAGEWEIVYPMRATTPGEFRALPATAAAMYVPEIRGNSDAQRLRIAARESLLP